MFYVRGRVRWVSRSPEKTYAGELDAAVTALGSGALLLDVQVPELAAGGPDHADLVGDGVVPGCGVLVCLSCIFNSPVSPIPPFPALRAMFSPFLTARSCFPCARNASVVWRRNRCRGKKLTAAVSSAHKKSAFLSRISQ